ncbi:MAG: DUF3857 domain-containing protein [Bacteroidales bacterium]|nr:DUF3857 domain-containing protein [Bacteroidales bacterium]MBN2748984.1 DUF3857 domain-containing protein [Bacteroidales bacterium]
MKLKYILGFVLAGLVSSCSTELTPDQKIADAVLLKQVKEYTLNADGSYTYRYSHKRLYNTHFAFHRLFGETFVVYNPDYQTLKVNQSVTTMADGKKVASPENAYNEVLPFAAADAPAYNKLREMVITHPGLEIGAVVELDYEVTTKAGFKPFLSEHIMLTESSPIQNLEVIVRVPKGAVLNHALLNAPKTMEFKKSTKGEYDVYSWNAANVPSYSHEAAQKPGLMGYAQLMFSTVSIEATHKFITDNLTFTDEAAIVSPSLESSSKDWELVSHLQSVVVNQLNTYRVAPAVVGFQFRKPADVWSSNGGTEGEKAILLAALLQSKGITAQAVAAAYPYSAQDGIIPELVDRFFVKVTILGEERLFSVVSTSEKVPGIRSYLDSGVVRRSAAVDKPLSVDVVARLSLTTDGKLSGTADVAIVGSETVSTPLLGLTQPTLSYTKEQKGADTLTFSCNIKGMESRVVEGYYRVTLPDAPVGLKSMGIGELPTLRKAPVWIAGSVAETYSYTITLPEGYRLVSKSGLSVRNELGEAVVQISTTGSTVEVKRSLKLVKGTIPAEEYPLFRDIYNAWMDSNASVIVVAAQ